MGSFCGCFRIRDEENVDSNTVNNRNRVHPNGVIQSLTSRFEELLGRQQALTVSSSIQGAASSNSVVPPAHGNTSHSRQLQQNVLVPTRGRQSGQSQLEAELLRRSNFQIEPTLLTGGDKWRGDASKVCHSESSMKKVSSATVEGEFGYDVYASSEDEDVCPTCLEEYAPENPKINTQCSHHFHLGCIYEWMERSELCPVCATIMVFDETI